MDILLIARRERNKFFVIDAINKSCTVERFTLLRLCVTSSINDSQLHAKTQKRRVPQRQNYDSVAAHGS
jgi:hypothetical protein